MTTAANRDALARPASANTAGVLGYLEAVREGADHEAAREAGQRARKSYWDIYGTED